MKAKVIKDKLTYTADTESIKIIVQNLAYLLLCYSGLGTGTTATTLANLVAHSSAIKLTVGGNIETLVKSADLFALNWAMYHRHKINEQPWYINSTTTDNTVLNILMILPVKVTTDKEIYIELAYTGVTDSDTGKLSITAIYGNVPFPNKPIAIRYVSANVTTTGTEHDMSVSGRKLIGLLGFGTTIPNGTTDDATLGTIKVLINREERYHITFYDMPKLFGQAGDTVLQGVLDNYIYLDFEDEPFPAEELVIFVKSYASATDAFRLIGVYE